MNRHIRKLIFGRNPLVNAALAMFVISAIVLGCTCNDKDGFKWGSNSSKSNASDIDRGRTEKADASKGEMPEGEELDSLVRKTLLDFNRSLQNEDFTEFHKTISSAWQKQVTPRQMKKAFQQMIDKKTDIGAISEMDPVYTSPTTVDSSNPVSELRVRGKFETRPIDTKFDLTFIPDGRDWKLGRIEIYAPGGKAR